MGHYLFKYEKKSSISCIHAVKMHRNGAQLNLDISFNITYTEISEVLIVVQSVAHQEGIRYFKTNV